MLLVSPRVEAPRMEPHLSLQGSVKRKLGDDNSPASSAMPDIIFPSDNKRLCLDDVTLSMGQGSNPGPCPEMQHSPFSTNHNVPSMGVAGHGMLLENNHMNGSGIRSPFSVPPNAEVGQKGPPLGGPNSLGHYDEKGGSSLQSVDQELQDLLEELTKMPDPSPNELDLEKILASKTDEPLGSLGHPPPPSISSTPKSSPQTPHLENHVSGKDFSPGCNPASVGSPQMRPSSAGASYPGPSQNKPVASPISSAAPSKSQGQPMLPVSLPSVTGSNWHAQQLKHLAASKQVPATKHPAPSWSAISSQGLSPPYRQGSSPHHPPFSPQNVMVSGMSSSSVPGSSIQSPQSSLLSSITSSSNPSAGPSPAFGPEKLSSPVLNQQPFSPPNPILSASSIPTNSIKSPQSNLVPANTGPSPPYRPEKLSSPALHQPPFSPQSTLIPSITPSSNPSSMQSPLFKPMSAAQTKNLSAILQQSSNGLQPGLVADGPVAQDQLSFNNTKPLSHFTSESAAPQKMSAMPPGPGQQSLIHYLQQQHQQQQVAASQQPQQVNSQYVHPQLRHLMQPFRMQRHMQQQQPPLPSQARQDQTPGIIARLQEPGAVPNTGSVSAPAPAMVNGYTMRNHLLKQQIIRRQQQLQEKQRHSVLGVVAEQRSFVGQQINQFPAASQADCSQSMQTPPPNHRMMPSAQGILQNTLASGIAPAAANQNSGALVMVPHNSGKQPGMFPPNSDFSLPLRPSQNTLGMSSGCQTVHGHHVARPGMALPGFPAGSLANHSAAQQHLRPSAMPRIPNVYSNSAAQMWTAAGVPRMPNQTQMDASMQQFASSPLFSKQNTRPNIPGQQFSHQAVVPPNQIAPSVQARQMQKVNLGQSGQSLGTLNNQPLRHNLTRGPLPAAMNVMKCMPQGVSGFNQLSPAQGVGPPGYPGSTSQPSGTFSRMNAASELPPQYEFVTQQNNSLLPGNRAEADFIDSLMKNSGGGGSSGSTDEDWLNNLTMIDDILGQHIQSSGHV